MNKSACKKKFTDEDENACYCHLRLDALLILKFLLDYTDGYLLRLSYI